MFEEKLYLKILRYLKKFGPNHPKDIYFLFKNSHSYARSKAEEVFQLRPDFINGFLQKMKDDGNIDYTPSIPPGSPYVTDWETPFEVKVSITYAGYAYISAEDVGISSNKLAWIALFIAALSCLIDACQAYFD